MLLLDLPSDILIELLCACELKDLLRFEQTCRALRDLVSTQQVWLAHLRRLDQARAPDLPIHIDVHTLKSEELRKLVIRAVQAYDNCRNGIFGRNAHGRDICIELDDPLSFFTSTIDDPLALGLNTPGRELHISPKYNRRSTKLVPGGEYLFIQWSHGFVQLVDVRTQKAVWTYPEVPSPDISATDTKGYMYVQNYNVDFRDDGMGIIVLSGHDTEERGLAEDILIEVLHIDLEHIKATRLYSRRVESKKYPDTLHAAIQGDFLALLCIGPDDTPDGPSLLILANFTSDEIMFSALPDSALHPAHPKISIIRGHLFLSYYASKNLALSVLDIRHLFATLRRSDSQSSSTTTAIDIGRLGFTDFGVDLPFGFVVGHATLPSLCSFHWKEKPERFDQLSIQFTARSEQSWINQWPVLNRYAFTPRKSDTEPPSLILISSTGLAPSPFCVEMSSSTCLIEQLSISGRSIMRHSARKKGKEHALEVVLSTIDVGADVASSARLSSLLVLQAMPEFLTRDLQFDLDYLSGAIISTEARQRWIRVTYPA